MIKYLVCLASFIFVFELIGQESVHYNFDSGNCSYAEANGSYADATAIMNPDCSCGVIGDGLFLKGNDNLIFPDTLKELLEDDFTLSFYFNIEQEPSAVNDIFSIRYACNFDSLLSIRYEQNSNTLITEFGNSISDYKSIGVELDKNRCWNRYTLTKNDRVYSVYLNNELVESHVSNGTIIFGKDARMGFGISPCLASTTNGETRFKGKIDQFAIYTRALSRLELLSNYEYPERIITKDTTIFAGAEVEILTGPTCANSFNWEPQEYLDDDQSLHPVAAPMNTTQYEITFNNQNGCTSSDSLRIYVVDPDKIECEDVLLPTAFTPNNDGLNDRYGISNLFLIDDVNSFEVYDRWGNKLWEGKGKNTKWDGSYDGTKVDPGVYVYKIKYTCSGEEYFKVNNFSVIR